MRYILVILCVFLMGFKPNLDDAIVVHKQMCEHYTKKQYACFFVLDKGNKYAVVRDMKGDYQIWQLKEEWVLVWSRLSA